MSIAASFCSSATAPCVALPPASLQSSATAPCVALPPASLQSSATAPCVALPPASLQSSATAPCVALPPASLQSCKTGIQYFLHIRVLLTKYRNKSGPAKHIMILPGATLGMLGGGQLGRMFVHAATSMGYKVIILDPNSVSPAGEIAHLHLQANYDDKRVLDALAQQCSVVTTEFENVPAEVLQYLEKSCLVCPNPNAVEIAQNRLNEKQYAQSLGIPCTPFKLVKQEQDIETAFAEINAPMILKTTTLGYDGKGQVVVHNQSEANQAWQELNHVECILEKKINLATEISSVVARSSVAQEEYFPIAENVHRNGILFTSTVPASVSEDLQQRARTYTKKIAQDLNYIGVLAVEYFIDTEGALYFNEMAPRTHNSGHYTIDACYTSQFEQQVRAICGLPLGNVTAHTPVTMVNLLGDLWGGAAQNQQPDWGKILTDNKVKLHLYGKQEARSGRKMGHFCVLADDVEMVKSKAEKLFSNL